MAIWVTHLMIADGILMFIGGFVVAGLDYRFERSNTGSSHMFGEKKRTG